MSRMTAQESAAGVLGPRISHRKTGTPASLAALIAFDIVTTRACGSGSAAARAGGLAVPPGCTVTVPSLAGDAPPTLPAAACPQADAGGYLKIQIWRNQHAYDER